MAARTPAAPPPPPPAPPTAARRRARRARQAREIVLEVARVEVGGFALGGEGAAPSDEVAESAALGGLRRLARKHALLGAELADDSLERAKLLVVDKLARAELAGGGVDVGHAHVALIRAHGHPDGGDHRNVGHLADAVKLLLEGAQSARAGGARELPSLSRGLLVQLDHAIGAVEQEVAEHRLEEVTVEGDAGQGGLAVTEVLDHRGGLVEGASDERGVVAVDGIEVLAVEDAKHLRVLGEGPEVGDEPLLVHLWRAEGGVGERDGVRSGHAILKKRASERSERDARGEAKSSRAHR